ncbi:MBL fold metallo-hydrolase, partial [Oxalobacteraceae bacterium]|nr:MBL fold metallo-hydrolase [Oxalobacteraceae bacterium]
MMFKSTLIASASAVAALLALSTVPAMAESSVPSSAAAPTGLAHAQAGYYHLKVGEFDVIALSDGSIPIPPLDLLTNAKPGQVKALLADSYQDSKVDASVNAFLIKAGQRLILVDTGAGELYGPTLNKLGASLLAAGVRPEQITDILITHIHTDHSGGLMDGKRMVFPNALVHMDKKEADYWLSPANRAKAPASAQRLFDQAQLKVQPYVAAGKVKTFEGSTELFPGIRSIASYGHTPGHSFYALESQGRKLVFWGDLLHVAEVQMPAPEVTIVFDTNAPAAAATRAAAFADAAKGRYWVAGAHLSFPGVGHLRADGAGYRWVPMAYANDHVVPAP